MALVNEGSRGQFANSESSYTALSEQHYVLSADFLNASELFEETVSARLRTEQRLAKTEARLVLDYSVPAGIDSNGCAINSTANVAA